MMIYLATDHAGFEAKERLKKELLSKGYQVEDCGALTFDSSDDYPDFIKKAAEAVSKNPDSRAIIFGGSGQAEAIVANRYSHVRAVVWYGPRVPVAAADVTGRMSDDPFEIIRLSREHNDANILSIGVRFVSPDDIVSSVLRWLETPFAGDERHVRRIAKIDQ